MLEVGELLSGYDSLLREWFCHLGRVQAQEKLLSAFLSFFVNTSWFVCMFVFSSLSFVFQKYNITGQAMSFTLLILVLKCQVGSVGLVDWRR